MTTRHYITEHQDITAPTACGGTGYNFGAVTDRSLVTCKRCLASLAKRDRAFQRKARRQFRAYALGPARGWQYRDAGLGRARLWKGDAARAIAREEGLV